MKKNYLFSDNMGTTKLRNEIQRNETKNEETKRNEVGRHIIDHLQEELYLCKLFSYRGL